MSMLWSSWEVCLTAAGGTVQAEYCEAAALLEERKRKAWAGAWP